MNGIAFMIQDHQKLREALASIKNRLLHTDIQNELESFIANYQKHEMKERQYISEKFSQGASVSKTIPLFKNYHEIHAGAWNLIEHLKKVIAGNDKLSIQRSFLNLQTLLLSHFDFEEQWIFPSVSASE